MNADKPEFPDNLPMVEFHDDEDLSLNSLRAYQPPPPLPVAAVLQSATATSDVPPKPPVCHPQRLTTVFEKFDWQEMVKNCEPRSLLIAAILIPYLWFMMTGVTEGNVSWGVVLLLAGGSLSLGWYGFLGLAKLSNRRGEELALRAFQVFLATAIIGVVLLLVFQGALLLVDHYWQRPIGEKRLAILFAIIKILATGYHTAFTDGPLPNPIWYFLCTFVSVAFCEELLKLSPVLLLVRISSQRSTATGADKEKTERELLFFGAMSGMGFGFSEALIYTADLYRPQHMGFSIYFLRFMCLVILHGLWSFLSSALYLRIQAHGSVQQHWKVIGLAILGPMFLHALHNTTSLFEVQALGFIGLIITITATLLISCTICSVTIAERVS